MGWYAFRGRTMSRKSSVGHSAASLIGPLQSTFVLRMLRSGPGTFHRPQRPRGPPYPGSGRAIDPLSQLNSSENRSNRVLQMLGFSCPAAVPISVADFAQNTHFAMRTPGGPFTIRLWCVSARRGTALVSHCDRAAATCGRYLKGSVD